MKKNADISGDWIKKMIRDFIATSPDNTMQNETGEPAWDEALVGFASGADQIWQQYKEYVGAFHWTPWEVYNQHGAQTPAGPEELTVVAWVLPQRERVRKANRKVKKYPAEEWARIRIYGEAFNAALRRHVADGLQKEGHPAVAPMLVANWTTVKSERFSYASSWSERHAAYAAGLGTFGLCDGLITPADRDAMVETVRKAYEGLGAAENFEYAAPPHGHTLDWDCAKPFLARHL